ncbi:unnamed protein product [Brassica oleracea]
MPEAYRVAITRSNFLKSQVSLNIQEDVLQAQTTFSLWSSHSFPSNTSYMSAIQRALLKMVGARDEGSSNKTSTMKTCKT